MQGIRLPSYRSDCIRVKKAKSKVSISCLCPGPVDTNFDQVANVQFSIKGLKSEDVAKYAIDQMLKGKLIIIPGFKMKCAKFFSHFVTENFMMKVTYRTQRKKLKR